MLWEAMHFAYTNQNVRIIVVCPLEAQVKQMWEMIDDMVLHSGIKPLKNALDAFGIVGKIRKPWEVTFSNGSKIKAFTSGARSGGKADSVRGNEAHMIIVDEMDLMMPDDLNAITAMMQKTSDDFQGNKRLIVSSTPNGRRDMFYVFCHKRNVKEYWLPSFVNPHFTPADEKEQLDLLTGAGFVHEILADWGQQTTGVFKPSILEFVANPEDAYSYFPVRPRGCGPTILGVDWDKYGAGVNIVIVGNVEGLLKVLWREEIERSKFEHTLGAGVARIKELDDIFNLNYVYCDKGYGERQWEELVQLLPDGENRVKGRNFSSSVEETDPVTGKTTREEFKPFMVDNAVNLYEKKKVRFNRDDEVFVAQVTGYVQTRVSATGRPVFASMDPERIGDHALDAWMMALLGHTEQYGDLITPFESITPRTIDSNSALTPGDSKEQRNKTSLDFLRSRRPMSSTNRRASNKVFSRPGF
jgi:replicative DNA helicase